MDVVVLVVKNKRAHLRRIQNISFCANFDDGCERRESFYELWCTEESHFRLIFWKEERFLTVLLLLLVLTLSSFFPSTSLTFGRRCLIDCSVSIKKVEEIDTSISSSWRSHHPHFSSPLEVDGENPSKK